MKLKNFGYTDWWHWLPKKERDYADINSWYWLCFYYMLIPEYYYKEDKHE